MRTHYCGQVGESSIGQTVTVAGWAHRRRDHGGVIFVDLRDREGLLQIVFNPDAADVFAKAERVRNEYVLEVTGVVRARPPGTVNPNLKSGQVGIQNKIHPGDPIDKNLYDLPPEELTDVPVVCGSLREALGELRADHAFLLKGDVFNMDQIEAYMELKWEEVYAFEHTPHPIEFQMYYSV